MSANATTVRRVGGVDPGLASGGLVVIDRADRRRVLNATSMVDRAGTIKRAGEEAKRQSKLHHRAGWSDVDFLTDVIRSERWVERFFEAVDIFEAEVGRIDVYGVESFVDQAQHAKKMMKKRWTTPLVTGLLIAGFADRDITTANGRLVFQNAGLVLKQFEEEINRLKARKTHDRDLVVPGDRIVTNDHQRKALSHALALELRLPQYRPVATGVSS